MKNFRRLIALILALLALPMCFIACDKTGGADQTEDPNDTTEGIRVIITISGVGTDGEKGDPFLKTRDSEIFRVDPGSTLAQALDALCANREGASYTLENTGRFASFTYGSDTLEAKSEKQKDDSYVEYYFETTVNGTKLDKAEASKYVLNHNDVVEIYLVKGESFTAKE